MADALHPKTVGWFSYFPVEWLPDAPAEVRDLPRFHPASWQRVLLESLEDLVPDLNLHVVVLRKQFPRSFQFQRRNVTFHLIRTPGRLRAPSFYWLDTLLIWRELRRISPDLVHAWGTEQGAAWTARRLGYPSVVTIQGLYTWMGETGGLSMHEKLSALGERVCLPKLPLITTESRFSADFIRRRFGSPRVEQIEHAPAPLFHAVKREPAVRRRFIFIGRFESRKGAHVLLRALYQLRGELDFELLIVGGGGALKAQLQDELGSEFWQRIRFKQNLNASEIAAELSTATMMIYPTLVDVSPNTVKEAVVARLPVVASQVGGIPDYVIPGRNGLLFPPGDLPGCVQAIRAACQHPLFGRGLVDDAVAERMRDYLSPETMARRFWEAYQSVYRLGQ